MVEGFLGFETELSLDADQKGGLFLQPTLVQLSPATWSNKYCIGLQKIFNFPTLLTKRHISSRTPSTVGHRTWWLPGPSNRAFPQRCVFCPWSCRVDKLRHNLSASHFRPTLKAARIAYHYQCKEIQYCTNLSAYNVASFDIPVQSFIWV